MSFKFCYFHKIVYYFSPGIDVHFCILPKYSIEILQL